MKSRLHHAPRNDPNKCVRMTYAPFAMKRLPTEEADKLVNGGMAVFVSRTEWKNRVEQKKAA